MAPRAITREDIAEIHEAIARRRPAQTQAEALDQQWHAYAAAVIRENDRNFIHQSGYTHHPRQFTFFRPWLAPQIKP